MQFLCNIYVYIVLFVIAFPIIIGIRSVSIYFHWYFKGDANITNINPGTEIIIYWTYKWEISNKLKLKIEHITFLMIWSILLKTLIRLWLMVIDITIQKYWHLLHWVYNNKIFWLCKINSVNPLCYYWQNRWIHWREKWK